MRVHRRAGLATHASARTHAFFLANRTPWPGFVHTMTGVTMSNDFADLRKIPDTWHVFPLRGKHPLVAWTTAAEPLNQAKPANWPQNMTGFGISCGPSGLVVLDLDGERGLTSAKKLFEKHGVPKTLTVQTGGGGLHFYFKSPLSQSIRNSASKLAPGIDVRATGGYVVGPGSRHPSGGSYFIKRNHPTADLPSWLLEALTAPDAISHSSAQTRDKALADVERGRVALTKQVKRWSASLLGSRNDELNSAVYQVTSRFGHALTETEIGAAFALANDGLKPAPLSASEFDATMRSALTAGLKESGRRRGDWKEDLTWNAERTEPQSTPANIATVFRYHPALRGLLRYNERAERVQFTAPPPWASDSHGAPNKTRDLAEEDITNALTWLRDEMRITSANPMTVLPALEAAAKSDKYDPFKEYLTTATTGSVEGVGQWDGTPRLNTWLIEHGGAADTAFNRQAFSKWLISAVARTLRPGCQADHVLILEGAQGLGKSSFFAALGGDYFSDDIGDITSKDAVQQISGFAILEFGEIDHLNHRSIETVKAFLTRRIDNIRAPYARTTLRAPRRCVFAGTTNRDSYFRDVTGARRFWPVALAESAKVRKHLAPVTARNRDQLWAEAVTRYNDGEPWWFVADAPEVAEFDDLQEERRIEHPYEGALLTALSEPLRASAGAFALPAPFEPLEDQVDEATGLLNYVSPGQAFKLINVEGRSHADACAMSESLKALRWEKRRVRHRHAGRLTVYCRPSPNPPEGQGDG